MTFFWKASTVVSQAIFFFHFFLFLPFFLFSFSISFPFFTFSLAIISWIQPKFLSLFSSSTIISETHLGCQAEADFEPHDEKHPSHRLLIIYFLCPNFSVSAKYYFLCKSNIFASFKRSFPLFPKVCRHKIVFLCISLSETLHLEI